MKLSFNENWICYKTGEKEDAFAVTLPHDAMQLDERSETSAGGVNTAEVNSHTLESLFCPGIFFAGDLLDIDGACGGYNLQWAWASGAVSGTYAAKSCEPEKGGTDL